MTKRELSIHEKWEILGKYNYPSVGENGFILPESIIKRILRKLGFPIILYKLTSEITTREVQKQKHKATLTLKNNSIITLDFEDKHAKDNLKNELYNNNYVYISESKMIARDQIVEVEFDEVVYKENETSVTYYMVSE